MTALVAFCFNDGAFLVADTQRLITIDGEENKVVPSQALKIAKLTPLIGIASAGNPIDEAKFKLQVNVKPDDTKDRITELANEYYGGLLNTNPEADTRLILFGVHDQVGFIRHLSWEDGKFSYIDYGPNNVVADGTYPEQFKDLAERCFKYAKVPVGGYQLNFWSQIVMENIVSNLKKQIDIFGANPVEFPIDTLIFRANRAPHYARYFECNPRIKELIKGKIQSDIFTVMATANFIKPD